MTCRFRITDVFANGDGTCDVDGAFELGFRTDGEARVEGLDDGCVIRVLSLILVNRRDVSNLKRQMLRIEPGDVAADELAGAVLVWL